MNPRLLLSPRTSLAFLDQSQKFLWRCRTPLPFCPQPWPSAELCRRGSCYTLIRGDSNNSEQLSYPAPGFGAPCASTALGGASPGSPQSLCPPGHDSSALAEPQLGTAGAPGIGSAAGKPSCCPGAPGEDAAARRGHGQSPPHTLSHLRAQGLWCAHLHSEMSGEQGPSLLLLLSRRFPANPRVGGTEPLPGPDLLPPASIPMPGRAHKGRRSPSPALPPPPPAPMEPPGDAPPDPHGRGAGGAGGDTGTHGHRRGCGAAARGRPASAPPRADRDVSPRRPLAPHALRAALTHRGRTERVPARTERGGRRRAQNPQRLPRPPPPPSPYTLPALSDTSSNQSAPAGT